MALAQTDLPELKRFTFFVSRRFEEGRERFRLHMGHFATLAEAEEWLNVVREIYPGAWAGEAPGRKIRERAAAAAAAAQHAVGPQTYAVAPLPQVPAVAPRGVPAAAETPSTSSAPAARPLRVPVVHAAPPVAHAASRTAQATVPREPPRAARPPASPAPVATSVAATPARTAPAPTGPARTAPAPSPAARTAPARIAPAPSPAAAVTPAAAAPVPVAPAARAPVKPAPVERSKVATSATRSVTAAAPRAEKARPGKPPVKPVFEDSNVREVLKALADASATGETRLMQAPPPPREVAAPESGSLSDTQVLRLLEARRSEGGDAPGELAGGSIPLLKPDDTGTRRALREAVASNAAVSFAVQLQWSVQPVELDKVPPLAIFSAYTLYTVEGSRDGRKWYGLRLGFFSDAISAKQVAQYVRSEFTSVAVVPVSPQEKGRASDQEQEATFAAPVVPRERVEEFKLIDDGSAARAVPAPAAPATKADGKPAPRLAIGRALRQADAEPRARAGKVGARDRRGPHTLEETLEILGASELSIDNGNGESINDSGVRHLRVQVQKNSPFTRLLERLSERMKKS